MTPNCCATCRTATPRSIIRCRGLHLFPLPPAMVVLRVRWPVDVPDAEGAAWCDTVKARVGIGVLSGARIGLSFYVQRHSASRSRPRSAEALRHSCRSQCHLNSPNIISPMRLPLIAYNVDRQDIRPRTDNADQPVLVYRTPALLSGTVVDLEQLSQGRRLFR